MDPADGPIMASDSAVHSDNGTEPCAGSADGAADEVFSMKERWTHDHALSQWYADARAYWCTAAHNNDGVLSGYGHVHDSVPLSVSLFLPPCMPLHSSPCMSYTYAPQDDGARRAVVPPTVAARPMLGFARCIAVARMSCAAGREHAVCVLCACCMYAARMLQVYCM